MRNGICIIKLDRLNAIIIHGKGEKKKIPVEDLNYSEFNTSLGDVKENVYSLTKMNMNTEQILRDTKVQISLENRYVKKRKIIIKRYIKNIIYVEELLNIYSDNMEKERNNSIYYTDGSLIKQSPHCIKMGVGWVQIENNRVVNDFAASTKFWPSSSKAEYVAVLTALCTVKDNSHVTIFTDSNNVISIYNKWSNLGYRKQNKVIHHDIWSAIFDILILNDINVTFIKVKAHTNNEWNELADQLAKGGTNKDDLNFLNESDTVKYREIIIIYQ
jgi:ribonuclease HI